MPRPAATVHRRRYQGVGARRAPPTGKRSWRLSYRHNGRLRVFTIGPTDVIDVAQARRQAWALLGKVAQGEDPAGEKLQGKRAESFTDVAQRYREQHAKRVNKSWQQAAALVDRYLLPRWGTRKARDVTRSDVRALIEAPIMADQTLAAASAVFAWAIKQEVGDITVNPCVGVDRNATTARERALSDSELQPVAHTPNLVTVSLDALLQEVFRRGYRITSREARPLLADSVVPHIWNKPNRRVLLRDRPPRHSPVLTLPAARTPAGCSRPRCLGTKAGNPRFARRALQSAETLTLLGLRRHDGCRTLPRHRATGGAKARSAAWRW